MNRVKSVLKEARGLSAERFFLASGFDLALVMVKKEKACVVFHGLQCWEKLI